MGHYLNPKSEMFKRSLRSKIYVDKSSLIDQTNQLFGTDQNCICISRPRRFGKTMGINLLAAYYGCGEDTSNLFLPLKISSYDSFYRYLNKHDVIFINMQEFLSKTTSIDEMLTVLQQRVIGELFNACPIDGMDREHLDWAMQDVYLSTGRSFVILIDEWDCLFRDYQIDIESQKKYLDFLRMWLKDRPYVGLAYMTGILPIKKYGSHSALNMFSEFSMTQPEEFASYFGFTETEVIGLCTQFEMNFEETKSWYDGYHFLQSNQVVSASVSIYSPKSVVEAMLRRTFRNYWNQTETYEALKMYIQMDYDGLKNAIITMLAGGQIQINTGTFSNDMTTFTGKNDILTLLIHLGYLAYDESAQTVTIPNKEVSQEYVNAIESIGWNEVIHSIENSQKLLQALWNMDGQTVAEGIDQAHQEISILQYNDENALSYTIQLAFYTAREYYTIIRELPAGKGFADICLIPRRLHADKPAVIIELKWNKSAAGAISQIKERQYVNALEDYKGDLLLVGINYDKASKGHRCMIEKMCI